MEVDEAIEIIKQNLCTGEAKGRCIVVLISGWVFVGNLTKVDDDSYLLTDAKNIRRWEKVGFGGLTKSPSNANAMLDDSQPIKFPKHALIFYSPVSEGWK